MAHANPIGRPPPGTRWYATSTPQPSQVINDLDVQDQKQEEKYTQYTSISTNMTTGSPMRYNSYVDLLDDRLDEITKRTDEAQLKKLQDNFNEMLGEMYEDTIKQLQSINDLDAQYQKQDENDIQCKLDTTSISTTTGTSPTRYDLQGIHKTVIDHFMFFDL
eukprot:scaffold39828_cov44-Attheya_sp.AAC.2